MWEKPILPALKVVDVLADMEKPHDKKVNWFLLPYQAAVDSREMKMMLQKNDFSTETNRSPVYL